MRKRFLGIAAVALTLLMFASAVPLVAAIVIPEAEFEEMTVVSEVKPAIVDVERMSFSGVGFAVSFSGGKGRVLMVTKNVEMQNMEMILPEGAVISMNGVPIVVPPPGMKITVESGTADRVELPIFDVMKSVGLWGLLRMLPALLRALIGKVATIEDMSVKVTYMRAESMEVVNLGMEPYEYPEPERWHWIRHWRRH